MECTDEESRKLYCGNLSSDTDEEILHELFLQAGPLEKIILPKDNQGYCRGFAFIVFKHECSVPYSIDLFRDTTLYGRLLQLRARRNNASNANHQRSYSEPTTLNNQSQNAPVSFDALLALSKHMLTGNSQLIPPPGPTFLPPQGGSFSQPWTPNQAQTNDQCGFGPNNQGHDEHNSNQDRGSLSRTCLQGNWSSRNDSSLLPSDNFRRSDQRRRSDRDFRTRNDSDRSDHRNRNQDRHDDRSNYRRDSSYDRNQDYRDSYGHWRGHSREKSHHDRHSGRDGSRSEFGHRRGRY